MSRHGFIRYIALAVGLVTCMQALAADVTLRWEFTNELDYTVSDPTKIRVDPTPPGQAELILQAETKLNTTLSNYFSGVGNELVAFGPNVSLRLQGDPGTYPTEGILESRTLYKGTDGIWTRLRAKMSNTLIENNNMLGEIDVGEPSLIWLFHFNDQGGQGWKDAVRGNNCSPVGGARFSIDAKLGSHSAYLENNAYVALPYVEALNGARTFSIAFWMKLTEYKSYAGLIFTRGRVGIGGFHQQPAANKQIRFRVYTTSSFQGPISVTQFDLNKWYFVVGTWGSGQNVKMYINGQFDSQSSTLVGSFREDDDWKLGWDDYASDRKSSGYFDELAFFKERGLTPDEIMQLYLNFRSVKFFVRSGTSTNFTSEFGGPDGTERTWYTGENDALVSTNNFNAGHPYMQYKAQLYSDAYGNLTPYVDSVSLETSVGAKFDTVLGDFVKGARAGVTNEPTVLPRPYLGLRKKINGGYPEHGMYTSRVLDAGDGAYWTQLSWDVGEDLPFDLSGLIGLWHMDGDWAPETSSVFGQPQDAVFTPMAKLGSGAGSFNGTSAQVDFPIAGAVQSLEFWLYNQNLHDGLAELSLAAGGAVEIWLTNRQVMVSGVAPSDVTLYVNGKRDLPRLISGWNHVAFSFANVLDISSVTIGMAGDDHMEGLIDELALYDREIFPAEVSSHAVSGRRHVGGFSLAQVRGGTNAVLTGRFGGPGGSTNSYFNNGQDVAVFNSRYLQYRLFLEGGGEVTPAIRSVTMGSSTETFVDDNLESFLQGTFSDETAWYGEEVRVLDLSSPGALNINPSLYPFAQGVWHFDEDTWQTPGVKALDSKGDKHGTPAGDADTVDDAAVGLKAGSFDGNGDFVSLSTISLPGDFTVALWFKTISSSRASLISTEDASQYYTLEINGDGTASAAGKLAFIINDGSSTRIVVSNRERLNDNHWHHVAGIREGGQMHIYVDGEREGTLEFGTGFGGVGSGLPYVAYNSEQSTYYAGLIDEVAIWSRGLGASEITDNIGVGYRVRGVGTFVSPTLDASRPAIWEKMTWAADGPYSKPMSPTDPDLVALWQMEEASGSIVDEVGGFNGNVTGATYENDGRFGKCLGFDGSADYVTVNHHVDLEPDTITIEAWVNGLSAINSAILVKGDASGNGYRLFTDAQGYPIFEVDGQQVRAYLPLRAGKWTHLAGTYDGGQLKLYVDGDVNAQRELPNLLTGSALPFYIGHASVGGLLDFEGRIDQVAIHNVALGDEAMLDHYKAGAVTLKFQARAASNTTFQGVAFVGPDGTTNTFYTEASGSDMIGDIALARYFQYKAYLSTEDYRFSPRLGGVLVDAASYPTDYPFVMPYDFAGKEFLGRLLSFTHSRTSNPNTDVKYQLSGDTGLASRWFYWDGTEWSEEEGFGYDGNANYQTTINQNIPLFYKQLYDKVGGALRFRAMLASAGDEQMAVDWVEVKSSIGRITLLKPNGEEINEKALVVGVPYEITWESGGTVSDNIIIELWKFADVTNRVATLASGIPNTGSYTNIITADEGQHYRIRIRDGDDETIEDYSDSNFWVIFNLRLTAPNGGERWYIGQENPVAWDAPGPAPAQHVGSPLNLWFSYDDGVTWVKVADPVNSPGLNTFPWDTPTDDWRLVSENAKMAISTPTPSPQSPLTYRVDFSDSTFTNAGIVVRYPTTGSGIKMGNVVTLEWQAAGAGDQGARVDFYNGVTWTTLVESVTCDPGFNTYTAPLNADDPTEGARIFIVANADTNVWGLSAAFTLADINIFSPLGGTPANRDRWQINSTNIITWSAGGVGDAVDIAYSTDPADFTTNWTDIFLNYPSTNSATVVITNVAPPWVVPGPPSPYARVRVLASDPAKRDLFDITDFFDIAGVQITKPNRRQDYWEFAETNEMTWMQQGAGANIAVDLAFINNPTTNDYETILNNISIFSGFYQVPPNVVRRPSNFAKMRIRSLSQDSMVDYSDEYFTIRGLSMTSPTNRAVYTLGRTVTEGLQWYSAATEDNTAELFYSPDGTTFTEANRILFSGLPQIGNVDGGAGWNRQNWVISSQFVPSTKAKVKVVAGPYESLSPEFTMRGVRITRPIGTTLFDIGAVGEILQWEVAGLSASAYADLALSTEGISGPFVTAGLPQTVFVAARGTAWDVDPDLDPTTNVVLRFTITTPTNDTDVVMYSDAFTLRGLKVKEPALGTVWTNGTTVSIRFLAAGLGAGAEAAIYYAPDGVNFNTRNPVTEKFVVADGLNTFTWDIESSSLLTRTPSTNAHIQVVSGAYSKVSDRFTLAGIKVVRPRSTDVWAVSDGTNKVEWTAVGTTGPYDISFTHWEGGAPVFSDTIATGVSGSSYDWPMPINAIASNVTVTVTDGRFAGVSEVFEIVPRPSVRITSPSAGEFWKVSETNVIRWTQGGRMSNDFTLSYSPYPFTEDPVLLEAGTFPIEDGQFTYVWDPIPNVIGRTRIYVNNRVDDTITDQFDDFEIAARFEITPFVGNVYALEPNNIEWTTRGSLTEGVDLFYSTDPNRAMDKWIQINTDGPFRGIAHNQPSIYLWTVADVKTPTVFMRIQDHNFDGQVFPAGIPGPFDDLGPFEVQYFTIQWRLFDIVTSNELSRLSVTDSSGWSESGLDSPASTSHEYPYGTWDTVWFREYFYDAVVLGWNSYPSREVNLFMRRSDVEPDYHVMADFEYDALTNSLTVHSWLDRSGQVLPDPDMCRVYIYDENGDPVNVRTVSGKALNYLESDLPIEGGVFKIEWLNVTQWLTLGYTYFSRVEIDYAGATYSSLVTYTLRLSEEQQTDKILAALTDAEGRILSDIDGVQTNLAALSSAQGLFRTNAMQRLDSLTNSTAVIEGGITNLVGTIDAFTNQTLPLLDGIATNLSVLSGLTTSLDRIEGSIDDSRSRILTQPETMVYGSTNTVLYKSRRGMENSVVTTVDPGGFSDNMQEVALNIGIYQIDLIANWGLGSHTITCADPADGPRDSIVVEVIPVSLYQVPTLLTNFSHDISEMRSQVTNMYELLTGLEGLEAVASNVAQMVQVVEILGTSVTNLGEVLLSLETNVFSLMESLGDVELYSLATNVDAIAAAIGGVNADDIFSIRDQVVNINTQLVALGSLDSIALKLNSLTNAVDQLAGITNITDQLADLTNTLDWADVLYIRTQVDEITNSLGNLPGLGEVVEKLTGLSNVVDDLSVVTNIGPQLASLTNQLSDVDWTDIISLREGVSDLTNVVKWADIQSIQTDLAGVSNTLTSLTDLPVIAETLKGLTNSILQLAGVTNIGGQVADLTNALNNVNWNDVLDIQTQVHSISNTLEGLTDIGDLASKMDAITNAVSGLTGLPELVTQIEGLTNSLSGLDWNDILAIQDDVRGVTNQLSSLTDLPLIADTLKSLTNTIIKLSGVTNIGTQVSQLTNALNNVDWTDIEAIRGTVSDITNTLSVLQGLEDMATQLGGLSNAVAGLEGVTNVSSQLNFLTNALTGADWAIMTEINDNIVSVSNKLSGLTGLEDISANLSKLTNAIFQLAGVTNIGGQVAELTNALNDVDWMDVLTIRSDVQGMTNTLAGLGNLGGIATQLDDLAKAMAGVGGVTNVAEDIEALSKSVATIDWNDVTAIQNSVTNLSGSLTGLTGVDLAAIDFTALQRLDAQLTQADLDGQLTRLQSQISTLTAGDAIGQLRQAIGSAGDAAGSGTFFGRLNGVSGRLETIGDDASTAAASAQGAKTDAGDAASGVQRLESAIERNDVTEVEQSVRQLRASLESANIKIQQIPSDIETSDIYARMRKMADDLSALAASRGWEYLVNMEGPAVVGEEEGGQVGPDKNTIMRLDQNIQEMQSGMDFMQKLMDEMRFQPVVEETLLGVE